MYMCDSGILWLNSQFLEHAARNKLLLGEIMLYINHSFNVSFLTIRWTCTEIKILYDFCTETSGTSFVL